MKTKKSIYLVLWLSFLSHSTPPTTFLHVPPKCALLACFSLYLHVPPSAKVFGDSFLGPCCSAGITQCSLPASCHSDDVVPFCKSQQFKRVVQQNSSQASPDLVIRVVRLFSWRVSMVTTCEAVPKVLYRNIDE